MTPIGRSGWELVSLPIYLIKANLPKTITVASLCQKYQKATAAIETMDLAAKELTKSIGNSKWITEWKKLEEMARTKRGETLMIYNVSDTPGKLPTPMVFLFHPLYYIYLAPSQAKKQQNLIKGGAKDRDIQWLLGGLNLEAEQ